ncbi:DUF2807 domain-containing protein [Flavobacterium sp. MAH-1]|uniref:DUF2807 domain-containing protein n=1 Tax=Flavobacterium agri TaxID=2743471 RepID=A0A7Y9C4R1_9FLAO|nr:head GIN domain-containing protein [Flavobacterium agri]NUY80115.1 DUF2807 domain-containing protein [Flavobacterium agri]NYA70140.1 DUF2807 domain-containing protein [Flavobacterium agri]
MKKIVLFLTLAAFQSGFSQVTKDPGDFDKVKVFDRISAELVPSDVNKVEITGKRSKEVIVVNKNGELKLGMPATKLLQGEEIEAKIYYKEIKSVDASEGAYIGSGKPVNSAKLDVTAKEGAEIKLELDVEILKVKSVTGATIRLEGKASDQEISIGTGGIVEAKNLITERTDVSINAGGEAEVNASKYVKARTKAGGEITIHGNPQTTDKKSILGGTITEE